MKKKLSVIVMCALFTCLGFAAKAKAQKFVFDFSKDFYPGVGYVYLNSNAFRDSVFKKADIIKNEYIIEKVRTTAALVPITLTLKVTVEKDGTLTYAYSDLEYVKDGSSLEMTPLVAVGSITNDFDKLLPQVFSDEAKYNAAKAKFYENVGMLFAMSDGLTEIRAAKFASLVKDAPINLELSVINAKMNESGEYTDYQYIISGFIYVSTLSKMGFTYYTNDDDKAGSAEGDKIKFSGKIKDFKKSAITNTLSFVVVDE